MTKLAYLTTPAATDHAKTKARRANRRAVKLQYKQKGR